MLQEVTLKLESRLRDFEGSCKVIRLDHAFSAFSSDVRCRLCLAGDPYGKQGAHFLDHADFSPERFNCNNTMITSMPLFSGFSWIIHIVNLIPTSKLLRLLPAGKVFGDVRKFSLACLHQAISFEKVMTARASRPRIMVRYFSTWRLAKCLQARGRLSDC
jgi:hypothetical protein